MSGWDHWQTPDGDTALRGEQVHVWRATLDVPSERIDALAKTLSRSERARAGRFHFRVDQNRFTAGRGLLRSILSRYRQCRPEELHFSYNAFGKPYLADPTLASLQFNVSHSDGIALIAVTPKADIGIDIERIRPDFKDPEAFAAQFFASGERRALSSLPRGDRHRAFFACWTRKEAYLKARGRGLAEGLDGFEVSVIPGQPALLGSGADSSEAAEWRLAELAPGAPFAAALAVRARQFDPGRHLRLWQWPDCLAV